MNVLYIYCSCCGYEAFDEYVGFSRTTASDDWYYCPNCNKETSNVDTGEYDE